MERLQEFSDEPLLKSSLWETSPVDCPPESSKFINAVVGLVPRPAETPESLLAKLQALEREFGRAPKQQLNEPRPLDLDLIAFQGQRRATAGLILPHPRAHLRRFVLQPLAEIAPELTLPGQELAVSQLLVRLASGESIRRIRLVAAAGKGNRQTMNLTKVTAETIRAMKGRERIAALTAYDFAMARLLDEAGIPLILVGDSLGMVVLGYADTTFVTMDEMEHHVRAVARSQPRALLGADLPYHSYQTVEGAVANARRLVAAGAEVVKAEGGRAIASQVRAIIAAGIPFLGHLGMLPQSVREEGGYHVKGKSESEHQALLADAEALVAAGAFAIILELVTPPVAREITEKIPIPTIGIGSGPHCDGGILVTPDLLGTSPDYIPRHAKPKAMFAEQMKSVILDWKETIGREQ